MNKRNLSRATSSASATYHTPATYVTATKDLPSVTLAKIKDNLAKSDELLVQVDNVEERGRRILADVKSSKTEKLDVADLVELDRALQAVQWVEAIKTVGKQLDDICSNIRGYAVTMLACHRDRWIVNLEKQLEEDLEAVKFPLSILDIERADDTNAEHSSEVLGRLEDMSRVHQLQDHFRMLCDLRLPEGVATNLTGLRTSDPLSIILKPLKKRFQFHFTGNKKTNNPEKPEWYLQQVSSWMRNSQKFFDVCVHPVRRRDEADDFPGHAKFCCGLLTLVVSKIRHDIEEIIYDDVTLSHLIDEVILFSRDVLSRDFSLFIPIENLPIVVLCDQNVFTRWISLERKFAFEKIDDLLLEDGSWQPSLSRTDVSKCILTFEALLQSITNRYKSLTSVQLQISFVDLQIELLEDLRLRLAQILRQEQAFPLTEKFCLILSSSQFVVDMLNNWNEIPLFLQLQHEKNKMQPVTPSSGEIKGLFHDISGGFDFLVSDLIKTLSEFVFYEVKSRSRSYRCDVKWFSYVLYNEAPFDNTPESFPMFQILAAHLTYLSSLLNGTLLLSRIVRQVCERLCHFFICEVVLENIFSVDGSRQVVVDIEQGINAIFEPFLATGSKPDSYEQLQEVCKLLTLKQANALLLLESLKNVEKLSKIDLVTSRKDGKSILEEFEIIFLDFEQGIKILKRRIDLQ